MDLLDRLPDMDIGARTANDQILMHIVSLCVLQQRMGLGSEAASAVEPPIEVGVPAD